MIVRFGYIERVQVDFAQCEIAAQVMKGGCKDPSRLSLSRDPKNGI